MSVCSINNSTDGEKFQELFTRLHEQIDSAHSRKNRFRYYEGTRHISQRLQSILSSPGGTHFIIEFFEQHSQIKQLSWAAVDYQEGRFFTIPSVCFASTLRAFVIRRVGDAPI
jgi:hypothetical protein